MELKKSSELLYKVYYSNGNVFEGTSENVGRTPIWEVLVIVEKDKNHGRKLICGADFYIYQDNRWISCDYWTMMQYMAREGMEKRFLVGVMVSDECWTKVMTDARNDPDFPVQTAFYPYESKVG